MNLNSGVYIYQLISENPSASYHQRVDEILRKNFGSGSKENQKELLPTEYTLYQNYPNLVESGRLSGV